MKTLVNNLAQQRAKKAYDALSSLIKAGNEKQNKEIKSAAKHLPTMIQQAGLIGSVVYSFSKTEAKRNVMMVVLEWLRETGFFDPDQNIKKPEAIISKLVNMDNTQLSMTTSEAVAIAIWVSKMASALIEEDKGGGN